MSTQTLSEILGHSSTQTEATQVTRWVRACDIVPAKRGVGSGSRHQWSPTQARLLRLLLLGLHRRLLTAFRGGGGNGVPYGLIRAIWDDYADWPLEQPYPTYSPYSYHPDGWRPGTHKGCITLVIPIQEPT